MIYCIQTEDDAGRIQNNYADTADIEEDLQRIKDMGMKLVDCFPCPWKEYVV